MTCAWSTFRLAFRAQVPEKFQRPQNGDVAKRGHRKKIPATRDEAVRFSCPCSLEKFIVVRITAAQYGSFDQHPFRDDLELPEEEEVACHGVLWLLDQIFGHRIIDRNDLCTGLGCGVRFGAERQELDCLQMYSILVNLNTA